MRKFVSRVGWIGACVDAARCNDAEEEDRVPDVVERVDADAVAALETYCAEPGGELADGFEGAAGGDVVGGVQGGNVDLGRKVRKVFRNGFPWMDGWMDGWVGGWTDGWMDGWMGGWVRG